jgi:hypothetical protein
MEFTENPLANPVRQAAHGPKEVLVQFKTSTDVAVAAVGFSQYFIKHIASDLELKPSPDNPVYAWNRVINSMAPGFPTRATIALRLEPLSCSKVVWERTNAMIGRILMPVSGGTNHSILLERVLIEPLSGLCQS